MVERILSLNPKQMDNIREFLRLSDDSEDLCDPKTEPEKYHDQVLLLLRILEAFGNDPRKAAECSNKAGEKASKAANNVCVKMLAHLPDAKTDDYYKAFDSIEEAFAYKEKVLAASRKKYGEILKLLLRIMVNTWY